MLLLFTNNLIKVNKASTVKQILDINDPIKFSRLYDQQLFIIKFTIKIRLF